MGGEIPSPEGGFTLVELLIVLLILPMVLGGAAAAIITSLKNDVGVSTRLNESHDAQISSAYFVRDVESSTLLGHTPECGSRSQFFGVEWNPSPGSTAYVSYVTQTRVTGLVLVRNYCSGTTMTASVLSWNLGSGASSAAVNISCVPSANNCASAAVTGSVEASDVSMVQLQVTEASGYQYSLTASPHVARSGSTAPPGGTPSPSLLLLGSGTGVLNCGGSGSSPFNVNGLAAIDSSSSGAAELAGGDSLTAAQVYTENSATPVTGAYTTTTASPYSSGPPILDPYADLPDPNTNGMTQYTSTSSLPGPGVYLNPVTITGVITIPSGIYVFEGGLTIQGPPGASVTGNGVMFFIGSPNASPSQSQTAAYDVAGNGVANLTPMTATQSQTFGGTPDYAGIVIFQSRTDSETLYISGNGTTSTYGGVIYAPDAQVNTAGNGGTFASNIIANSIACGGNGGVSIGASSVPSTTTLTSSAASPVPGQVVTFTASVSGSDGLTPAGSVTFTETPSGSTTPVAMCSNVALSNGTATCSTATLTVLGSPYHVTAAYSGNTMFAASSKTISQQVVPAPPGSPTGLTATAGDTQVALSWTAPTNNGGAPVSGYTVLYGTSSNGPFTSIATGSTTTSYTVTGLSDGTTYYFEVEAMNVAGSSTPAGPIPATPFVPTAPAAPGNPAATRGSGQVALTWTAPFNGGKPITDYIVLYSTTSGGPYSQIDTTSTATTYTVMNLMNGTPYFFEVEAVNSVGTGSPSVEISATPATIPGSPVLSSSVATTNSSAALSWSVPTSNGGSGITDYLVVYSTNASMAGSVTVDTHSANLNFVVTKLANNTQYYFEVVAVNAVGQGQPSNIVGGHT